MNREKFRAKAIRRKVAYTLLTSGLFIGGWAFGQVQATSNLPLVSASPMANPLSTSIVDEKVMVVGGSIAHGWKDPNDDSFIKRAFQSLSDTTNTKYTYDDHTITGASPVDIYKNGKYVAWIQSDKPNVVVISWGLLNDISDHTPTSEFRTAIENEIQTALQAHARVLLVTSPVVEANATYDLSKIKTYRTIEMNAVQSAKTPNAQYIDLNGDMSTYMRAHGQTWKMYYGDSWHPNQAGHELAGELLSNHLVSLFGMGPIQFEQKAKSRSAKSTIHG